MFQVKWVLANLKGKTHLLIIGLMLAAISTSMAVIPPKLTGVLIDDVAKGGKMELLFPLIWAIIIVTFIKTVLRYIMVQVMEVQSQYTLSNIRNKIYRNLSKQDMTFYGKMRTGDLMTRVTGDLDAIRQVCGNTAYTAVDSIAILLSSIFVLARIDWVLTLILFALTPFLLLISKIYMKKIRALYQAKRNDLSDLNVRVQENIAGNRIVKAFAREDYEKEMFDKQNARYRDSSIKSEVAWQRFWPVVELMSESLTVITILVGGLFVINGRITVGDLVVFSGLTWAVAQPMRNLGMILGDLQRFLASSDKVIEIYYAQTSITDRHDAITITKDKSINGKIEFKDVKFGYSNKKEDKPILDGINIEILPGETVAIMGPTGSGKTTLINLINRLYDINDGKLLIDDIEINQYKLKDLRGSIAIATQDVFIFSDSIEGAISYGDPDMSDEQVYKYAKAAGAAEFIEKMESSYDTIVGERGVGLSGGQRQRLSLARAIAVEPKILILDDTTSAVDMETEQYIQTQLKQLDFNCTKIIIAQRISSVREADKIFILDDGKIIQGTHDTLITQPGYYRDVCEIQDIEGLPVIN